MGVNPEHADPRIQYIADLRPIKDWRAQSPNLPLTPSSLQLLLEPRPSKSLREQLDDLRAAIKQMYRSTEKEWHTHSYPKASHTDTFIPGRTLITVVTDLPLIPPVVSILEFESLHFWAVRSLLLKPDLDDPPLVQPYLRTVRLVSICGNTHRVIDADFRITPTYFELERAWIFPTQTVVDEYSVEVLADQIEAMAIDP